MKLLFDLATVVAFYAAYKIYDLFFAVKIAMAAYLLPLLWGIFIRRRINQMECVTAALVITLGASSLFFENEIFFKWKPTVLYWCFAIGLQSVRLLRKMPLTQRLLGHEIQLTEPVWRQLDQAWMLFFIGMGSLNLLVAYQFSTETWVNFKLFCLFGLTLLFVIAQAFYLSRLDKNQRKSRL